MKTLNLIQGSPEWTATRAQHFCASDAPAMMGASKFTSRSELLHQKATGIAPDVSEAQQARYDRGHATEASARPIVEDLIGDDLSAVTGVSDCGHYLASLDGLTLMGDTVFEHKLWSDPLAAQVRSGILDMHYVWQLEHQLMVTGAERAIFVTSDGTREKFVHMEYRPVPGRRAALIAGWKQFAEDLKSYTPPATAPVVVAEPVQALPAVMVQVSGEITVRDNFKAFETALRDFLEHRLIREPETDQDFADLELQIKALKNSEEKLDAAESQMLAQVQAVDMAKKTKDMLRALVTENRIMAEKLVKSEKERRRGEIVAGGISAFKAHIDGLNQRLGKPYMPTVPADFGGAIKGMKSMTSMENAVATELARAKIAANEVADRIQVNLSYLAEDVPQGHAFLFADLPTIVLKAPDDFRAVVDSRIAAHKEKREREEAETRERIRAEEERKAQAAAQAEQDRIREEAAAKARQDLINEQAALQAKAAVPAAAPAKEYTLASAPPSHQTIVPEKTADTGARIKLGQINERIAPLSITADGLSELGFPHVATDKAAKLYRESDWPAICEALIQHITQVADFQPA